MNCKRHPSQDCPGVCAACLRDRLLDLPGAHKPEPSPPPRLSPLSASPGGSSAARRPCRLFFSTPQVGPAAPGGGGGSSGGGSTGFSLISLLFRHKRSEEEDMGSGSWLRALIHGGWRRKEKKPRPLPEKKTAAAPVQCRTVERGLSPATEESDCGSDSGYSTASSGAGWMPTPSPMRREEAAARPHQNERGRVSGFGFCLSPLVRASPGRRRSKPAEVGFSGDPRSGLNQQQHHLHHHHLRHASGGGAAFAANRSRKLADIGRFR